ncbi:MAG TPA: type II toxin-antitoxin system HicB family antitoxin [Chloroflexota bacterium]|nr:type II toxin-antitoxin system HicB family antitoxin [Chloroflexota bacterium]
MTRAYTIILEPNPDECIYTVTVPALPGCITQGRTVEECIARAKEAIAAWIADAVAAGETVPEETMRPQAIVIDVAA